MASRPATRIKATPIRLRRVIQTILSDTFNLRNAGDLSSCHILDSFKRRGGKMLFQRLPNSVAGGRGLRGVVKPLALLITKNRVRGRLAKAPRPFSQTFWFDEFRNADFGLRRDFRVARALYHEGKNDPSTPPFGRRILISENLRFLFSADFSKRKTTRKVLYLSYI